VPDEPRTPEDERRRESAAQLVEGLRALREHAGNPSFRRMSAASGYISHTTLHEAAAGSRLPSWETTREFVKACGGDEAEWRLRWDEAKNGPRPESEAAVQPEAGQPAAALSAAALSEAGKPMPKARRRLLVIAAVVLFLGATVAAVFIGREIGRSGDAPAEADAAVPPVNGPLYPGDLSRFVNDVTIPDGTQVKFNESFTKIWQIENAGTVTWSGRYLQREQPPLPTGDCKTPDRIDVGNTLPNEKIKIAVQVQAPAKQMMCRVSFKMLDDQGRQPFPGSRPIFFEVNVVP